MEKIRSKFILILTAVILITGLGIKYLLTNYFAQISFAGYMLIPVFFMILGLGMIYFLTQEKKENDRKLVNKYMLIRVIKILLSLVFILIYWVVNKPEIKNFATIFIVFYMIYLIFETYIYVQVEKMMKKNEKAN
ncbi:MAG: putative rane protein [Bacteroidetes bacterium]|nr:putative rane protein [Bacteroidota bacterium]